MTYPEIWQTLSAKLEKFKVLAINHKSSAQLISSSKSEIPFIEPEKLLSHLSFSHFIELIRVEDPLKRRFYEVECIKNAWKVRELERAIGTSLFERTGLSTNKQAVIEKINDNKPVEMVDMILF